MEKSTGALKASRGTFASLARTNAKPVVQRIPQAPATIAHLQTLPLNEPPLRSRRRISEVLFGHPPPFRYHQNSHSQRAVAGNIHGICGEDLRFTTTASSGGTPPIETTTSPIMIARTITGSRRHSRVIGLTRSTRLAWM